ncbi:MAG: glucan biosynthesis protein [Verrucomicrobia bacterium]|nr:glucan biosynthesis protein [Verrucomicrobiota bacterium]
MSKASSGFFLAFKMVVMCGLAGCAAPAAIEPVNVNFEYVRDLAAADASGPYQTPAKDLPPQLAALSYEDFRNIRFRPAQSLWRNENLPFQLQFFHRGFLFPEKITIREFSSTHEQVIPFVRDFFSYELTKDVGTLHSSLGYAGFRVHTPINRPDVYDEVIAFLGSSYFRAIGAGQIYGLSARGLAVDSGVVGTTEEFPRFTDFWVGKPAPGDTALTIYALLKGPSVTGAYEFIVRPGKATIIDVRSELIFRREVALPGVAPLTSMYWYGENSLRPLGQMRQEVHDSDGMTVLDAAGNRSWLPLHNPADPEFEVVPTEKVTRFGLLQRDRRIGSYEDMESHYEQRPSAWIEPQGEWGNGSVRLVQLPASSEYDDNIVAFWVPAAKIPVGQPVQYNYRIVWSLAEPANDGFATVVGTREGFLNKAKYGRVFWVDFADEQFATRDAAQLAAEVEVSAEGRIVHQSISPYPQIGGWRVFIETDAPVAGKTVNVRCRLRAGTKPISETWIYEWKS